MNRRWTYNNKMENRIGFLFLLISSIIMVDTEDRMTIELGDVIYTLPIKTLFLCDGSAPGFLLDHWSNCRIQASAVSLALENVGQTIGSMQDFWFLQNTTFNMLVSDGTYELNIQNGINALGVNDTLATIGLSSSCTTEAVILAASDKLVISPNCIIVAKKRPKIVQVQPSPKSYSDAIIDFLGHMGWDKIALIHDDSSENVIMQSIVDEIRAITQRSDIEIRETLKISTPSDSKINEKIFNVAMRSRIFVTLLTPESLEYFLEVLIHAGFYPSGNYFTVALMPRTIMDGNTMNDYENEVLRVFGDTIEGMNRTSGLPEAIRNLVLISDIRYPKNGYDYEDFKRMVAKRSSEKFACGLIIDKCHQIDGIQLSSKNIDWQYLMDVYDSVTLFAESLKLPIMEGREVMMGTRSYEYFLNRKIQSITGHTISTGSDGVNSAALTLHYSHYHQAKSVKGTLRWSPVGEFAFHGLNTSEWGLRLFEEFDDFNWIGGLKPRDAPKCGFTGQLCISLREKIKTLSAGIGAVIGIIFVAILLLIIRQWKYERDLKSLLWKISSADLQLMRNRAFGAKSLLSLRSIQTGKGSLGSVRKSAYSLRDWDKATSESLGTKDIKAVNVKRNINGEAERKEWLEIPDFATAKFHREHDVALKRVYKTRVLFNRATNSELKQMRELRHANLNPILGAVHEPPNVFIVSEICSRGSLKDMLESDEVKMDRMMEASIISDLTKGLTYIHTSPIGAHGRLKSSNCLLDSRWALRLSSYGLHHFRSGEEHEFIDSFEKEAQDIIENVKHPVGDILTRPDMDSVSEAPLVAQKMMIRCWAEIPMNRPNISEVRRELKPLQEGLKSNIMDNMINKMEQYTQSLEKVVQERSQDLEAERIKSEHLLHMMLPNSIADQLKRGGEVEPESYDCVSLYFSDIVGFTALSSGSTPMQVVTLLNDLYTCFDTILDCFDVYKVETIGDAYMVVSGLPGRNADAHAGEIAFVALKLLDAIKTFKVRHRPDHQLRLRIGIHSGPCVAGVVGLAMPRYCLFGDTVNKGSEMESSGEAMKIQCSQDCRHLLDKLGGFEVQRRKREKKIREQIDTYWLLSGDMEHRKERLMLLASRIPRLDRVL